MQNVIISAVAQKKKEKTGRKSATSRRICYHTILARLPTFGLVPPTNDIVIRLLVTIGARKIIVYALLIFEDQVRKMSLTRRYRS